MGHQLHSESSFDKTSPILEFLCCLFHFYWFCRVSSTLFGHQFQNSLDRCWTLLQCFPYYQSGNMKLLGDDITTFDFIVRRFTGLRKTRLVTSFCTSVVSGREFTIASTSTSRVCKDSLDKLHPWIFSKEFKIGLVLRIWFSQTPPMLRDNGGFLYHSPPGNYLIWSFCWSPRKVWTIVISNHSDITAAPYKSSYSYDEWICVQRVYSVQAHCVWTCLADKYTQHHIFWILSDHPSQQMAQLSQHHSS